MSDSPREIMLDFVARTGLGRTDEAPVRYLWTDAFAVCNLLGLHRTDGDPESLELALALVEQTHQILGRHRADDRRKGWISGLSEAQGARHPTIGGLRIGKSLPERGEREAFDPALEWDRDGQYFHYLTKWMVALERVAEVSGDERCRRWAVELARTSFDRFCVRDAAGRAVGLYWKMSIDLSRPLVPSMGQHDPLDGFLVYSRIGASAGPELQSSLAASTLDLSRICAGRDWRTDDVLGIGGLMSDAHTAARMMADGILDEPGLLRDVLVASLGGIETIVDRRFLDESPLRRLPFRELGLSIGLHAIERLGRLVELFPLAFTGIDDLPRIVDGLQAHVGLASKIEQFWLDPSHRRSANWVDHLDINEVMLATSLDPAGFLDGSSARGDADAELPHSSAI